MLTSLQSKTKPRKASFSSTLASTDQFFTKLKKIAVNCEFKNAEKEVMTQIIDKCTSQHLKQRALEKDMTLAQLLTWLERWKSQHKHTKNVELNLLENDRSQSAYATVNRIRVDQSYLKPETKQPV